MLNSCLYDLDLADLLPDLADLLEEVLADCLLRAEVLLTLWREVRNLLLLLWRDVEGISCIGCEKIMGRNHLLPCRSGWRSWSQCLP